MVMKQADELTGYLQTVEEQGDESPPSIPLPLGEGGDRRLAGEGIPPGEAKQILDTAVRSLSPRVRFS